MHFGICGEKIKFIVKLLEQKCEEKICSDICFNVFLDTHSRLTNVYLMALSWWMLKSLLHLSQVKCVLILIGIISPYTQG